MKTNKNILKNKKNNANKKNKTKKLKNLKPINKINQHGGLILEEDLYVENFMIEFPKNIRYCLNSYLNPKPDIILYILEKFYNNTNIEGTLDNKKIKLENLKISKKKTNINFMSKISPNISRYYHSYLILYFELEGEKYLLGTFGLTEFDNSKIDTNSQNKNIFNNPAIISLPDLFSIENSTRKNEKKKVYFKVEKSTKDIYTQVTKENMKFIISLFYVFKYSQNHCYNCDKDFLLPELDLIKCPHCKKGFNWDDMLDFSNTRKDSLIIYKICAFKEKKPYKYQYKIIFGKYSIASYRGVNCQTFCNLFINLCKGNPTYFKDGMLHKSTKSVVKRVQMIIYLFEINRILYRKKKENEKIEYKPYYLELNNYYANLISHLKFCEYTFKKESISIFRLPFLKLYSKLISGNLKTNLPEEKDILQLDNNLKDNYFEGQEPEPAEAEFKRVMKVLSFNELEEEF